MNRIVPLRFAGTFKLENGHEPSNDLSPAPGLPINTENLNIEYANRSPSYVNTVKRLATSVQNTLPDNVQVNLVIGPWGGNSAYDQVAIRVLSDDRKKILAERRFFRSINDYQGLNPSMFLPKMLRDNLFIMGVMARAKSFARLFHRKPEMTQVETRKYQNDPTDTGPYIGLW